MRLFGRLPRLYVIRALPIVVFLVAMGYSLATSGNDVDQASQLPSSRSPDSAAADFPSPTATQQAATPVATSTPSSELPPPPPPTNRANCDAIRGTPYESDLEQTWYQENCTGFAEDAATAVVEEEDDTVTAVVQAPVITAPPSVEETRPGAAEEEDDEPVTAIVQAPVITPPGAIIEHPFLDAPLPNYGYDLIGSNDRLVISRLGINAPVNYRGIGDDGLMGDPVGALDVVWYDFAPYPGLGGYPGEGGNAVIAGHVDYRTHGLAIFAPLRNIQDGDIIEYRRDDGTTVRYSVLWAADIPSGEGFNQYIAATEQETITLITCNGTFDQARREYDHRRVVRAARI